MTTHRKLPLKPTAHVVIAFGLGLFLVGKISHEIFFADVDPLTILCTPWTIEWGLRVLRDLGIAVGFGGMVVFGMLIMRQEGFSLLKSLMPAIGFFILLSVAMVSFYASARMNPVVDIPALRMEKLRRKAQDTTIPLAERSRYSKLYAEAMYDDKGIMTDYLMPDGSTSTYRPSDKEIALRQDITRSTARIQQVKTALRNTGLLWSGIAFASLLFGLLPIRNNAGSGSAS